MTKSHYSLRLPSIPDYGLPEEPSVLGERNHISIYLFLKTGLDLQMSENGRERHSVERFAKVQ